VPKTHGDLWKQIISFDTLCGAFNQARLGKRYTPEALRFASRLEENLINIQNHLIWKTWSPGKWREFWVYDPKWRQIQAPPFCDRVVHHALVGVVEPLFERKFIHDSYACRRGKGTHAAVYRLQSFLRRTRRHWPRVYVVKADISKYFPSINHSTLEQQLGRTLRDQDALWLCSKIIRENGYERRGIPVGALTSQLFANIYLNELDHFVKDELGVKHYVRYMDDFVFLGPDKARLRRLLSVIEEKLVMDLRLALNPKTCIFPASRGVDFAGYRTWATHIKPRKKNVTRMRKRLTRMADLYAQGRASLEDVRARVMSFIGYMKHCSGHVTTQRVLQEIVLTRENKAQEQEPAPRRWKL